MYCAECECDVVKRGPRTVNARQIACQIGVRQEHSNAKSNRAKRFFPHFLC